jgi:hypothetical protein
MSEWTPERVREQQRLTMAAEGRSDPHCHPEERSDEG